MRKRIAVATVSVILLMAAAIPTHAYTVGAWNYGYTVGTVRQNGTGFWFTVQVPSTSPDYGKFFGCWNTLPNYNTLVLIIMTAKATGKTVNFYIDNACLANGGCAVISITGVDVN